MTQVQGVRNFVTFKSTMVDDGEWDKSGSVLRPPGLQHSRLLASSLKQSVSVVTEPWNEEDYGWEFLCRVDGIRVGVLISSTGDGTWLVIVTSAVLFPCFRCKKIRAAQQRVSEAIEGFLKVDASFQEVLRCTESEYEQAELNRS